MKTTTIRVSSATRDRLNALARRRGTPAGDLVGELVRDADGWVLLADAEEGWEQLGDDPKALAAYRALSDELAAFESGLPEY